MNIPGLSLVQKAQNTAHDVGDRANQVDVPLTRRLGLRDFVKELFKQIGDDHVGAFAGNLAYQGLFAIFPFALFLVSLLAIFHATNLVNQLINLAAKTLPPEALTLIKQNVLPIAQSRATGAFTVSAVISILLALWGISGAFRAVMEAMNVMYNVKDTRPFWKKYAVSIVIALSVTALLVGAFVLAVFGGTIGAGLANHIGLGNAFTLAWDILQWPVLIAGVMLAFGLVYFLAPDVKQRFRFISPGSIVAVVAWLAFSLLFSLFVNAFGTYNKTYGTLAGLIILLLYMYYTAFFLLVGGEINQVIEEHAPGGKDAGEKVPSDDGGSSGHETTGDSPTLKILRENRPQL